MSTDSMTNEEKDHLLNIMFSTLLAAKGNEAVMRVATHEYVDEEISVAGLIDCAVDEALAVGL